MTIAANMHAVTRRHVQSHIRGAVRESAALILVACGLPGARQIRRNRASTRCSMLPIWSRGSNMIRTIKNTLCIPLASLAMVLTITAVAGAQWDPYPWKRVPRTADGKVDLNAPTQRTADGKPDLSGFWMPENPVKHLLNLAADLKPGEVPLQPWSDAVYKERIETNGKDHPGVHCWPSGIPEKNNIPDGLKLVHTPDLIIVLHESRTI